MTRRSRRAVLRAGSGALLAAFAGCLGAGGSRSPDGTGSRTDRSPTGTGTPGWQTPLPDRRVSLPDGPKDPPDHPDELTAETVRTYVRTYERRYAYNSLWYGETSAVNLDCEVRSVAAVGTGYEAVVACTGYSNTGGSAPNATATGTVLHADWGTQVFRYLVDEDAAVRERAPEA